MKIYTSSRIHNNKSYVGYLILGEKGQEYALNIVKANTIDSARATAYGISSALIWVKNNKPLYCNSDNIEHYQRFQDCKTYTNLLNKVFIKRLGIKSIKMPGLTSADLEILNRIDKNITWEIQKDCIFKGVNTR